MENLNFGQRKRESPALIHVCEKLRNGGAQIFTFQEANDILMNHVRDQGPVPADPKWKPDKKSTAVVAATQAAQTASSSGQAATAAAAPKPAVVAASAYSHKIFFVHYHEGYDAHDRYIPTLAFAGRSSQVHGIRMVFLPGITTASTT